MKRLQQRFSLSGVPSDIFCVRFSPDGGLVACGCADGAVRVAHASSGSTLYTLPATASAPTSATSHSAAATPTYVVRGGSEVLPVTALRWRPSAGRTTRNVLLAAGADGSVKHVHVPTQRVLSRTVLPDQLFALDIRADGDVWAAAGKDTCIYVHDEATGTLQTTLRSGGYDMLGHSNRIFSVKWSPDTPHVLVSGGWDKCVIMWDMRTAAPVRSFFGPHVCGDAIDLHGNALLAGSWTPEHQLAIFDVRGRFTQPVLEIPWAATTAVASSAGTTSGPTASSTLVYAAQFNGAGTHIAAGGSGTNEAKLFDAVKSMRDIDALPELPAVDTTGRLHSLTHSSTPSTAPPPAAPTPPAVRPAGLTGTIAGLTRAVYSLHFDPSAHERPGSEGLAIAGGDFLYVFDLLDRDATGVTLPAPDATHTHAQTSDATPHAPAPAPPQQHTLAEDAEVLQAYGGEDELPADADE